ncbi:hypothetical protein C5470_03930 [Photorhabdus stackebrandtii]|uniref:Uncharacterized protein n=1 Tax=Photorhabdus stackebrandtii TaxID=1123042 RepID=A0A7X5QJW8_9GAMM|nr:hypothetical protein [Photorhabdus stackebrandtii]
MAVLSRISSIFNAKRGTENGCIYDIYPLVAQLPIQGGMVTHINQQCQITKTRQKGGFFYMHNS